MASWPPPQSDPAASQNQSSDQSSTPDAATPTMSSENSDTVLIENPSESQPEKSTTSPPRPPPLTRQSTTGIKKCWICICDATEDDPLNPPIWRSPCTCNLTAHESCLLDWVADLENPKNHKRQPPPSKILCPQCKTEIKIARPKNYIVEALKASDRIFGQLVFPGLGVTIFGTVWTGFVVHGMTSVWLVFGPDDAIEMWRNQHHVGELAAYGLIPLSLIFSRTAYADYVLPGGTLFLAASQLREGFEIDWTIWPPRPSTVFACLPAMRSAYNWCYEQAFGELNRKWIAEVQPRQNEREEGQENNEADIQNLAEDAAIGDGGAGLAIEIDINIGGVEVVDEPEEQPQLPGEPQPQNANANNNNNNNVHQILGPQGNDIIDTSAGLGSTVLGALLFPAVSASMGYLLGLCLPTAWMSNANWMNGRPGLLRNRWGRSVVGGMAFVVLKDAVVTYCRWKVARAFRKRRILDYDRVRGTYILNS